VKSTAGLASKNRLRPRRLSLAILVRVSLLVVYVGNTAWQARQHLGALRKHVATLRLLFPSNLADVGPALADVRQDVASLRRDLALPLALAPHLGWLPTIGPTVQAGPTLFTAGEQLLMAGAATWELIQEPVQGAWAGDASLEQAAGALSARISAHTAELEQVAAEAREASASLSAVDATRLLPRIQGPVAQAQSWAPLLAAAMDGLLLVPEMTSGDGEHGYLLLAQNNEELRPTGGFISSIGVLTVTRGIPRLDALEDSYSIEDWKKPHPDAPEALRKYMGIDLWTTRDGNWWPDYPTSAEAVADLYKLNQGRQVDGVLALDMAGTARLLDVLAPLDLNGKQLQSGRAIEAFRSIWSLPSGSLVTPGVGITATRPFTEVELALVYTDKKGQVWFDTVMLEDMRRPGVNLVLNPSFEESADEQGQPSGWQADGFSAQDRLVSDQAHSGQSSLLVVGDLGASKVIRQRIPLSGEAGTRLHVSAMSRADNTNPEGGPYALRVTLANHQGVSETVFAHFPPMTHDWATAGSAEVLGSWWLHRKDFIEQVAQAALRKVLTQPSSIPWGELLTTAKALLDERHILLYMADPAMQSLVQRCGWSGALVQNSGDYLLVVDSNVGYNKTNTNVEQALDYEVTLDPSGKKRARLTIHYRHRGQAQDGECDKFKQYTPIYDVLTQGCYWDYVRIYVPVGAELVSGAGGDEPVVAYQELGRMVLATSFLLRPGEQRELHLEYSLSAEIVQDGTYELYLQKQAGTNAIPITVTLNTAKGFEPLGRGLQPKESAATQVVCSTNLLVDRRIMVRLR